MATFIESVLPSGKGIRVEKLNTKQYRAVQERVANRFGEGSGLKLGMAIGHEMLLSSLRAVTPSPIQWEGPEDSPDIDKMLGELPETAWVTVTYEDLVIEDGARSVYTLLDEPSDYQAAITLAQSVTLPNRDRAGSLAGKTRLVSVER